MALATVVEPEIDVRPWTESPKQDHLVCFLGGSLMLGTRFGESESVNARDWETGQRMVEGCMATHDTAT